MKADTLPRPIVKPIDAATIDETTNGDKATAQPRMAAMAGHSSQPGSS